jgi:Family of unknown function (DUF5681)
VSENETPEAVTEPVKPRRNQDGTWPKGVSGNPDGKNRGFRHRTTLAVEALLDGEAETITRRAIELAIAGELTAIRVCLDRIVPPRRDRTVAFELPRMETAADAIKALSAVADAVAAGEISPGEGAELGKLIDSFTRAIEASEFEERLRRLERAASK